MASIIDVATYICEKITDITALKLQKIIYYCQAWSLVWDEKPLFTDRIEAWINGPVVPNLYAMHRGQYFVDTSFFRKYGGNSDKLEDEQKKTIDAVISFYGQKTSQYLCDLTHLEDPWKNARDGLGPNERGNREITLDSMAMYYETLS